MAFNHYFCNFENRVQLQLKVFLGVKYMCIAVQLNHGALFFNPGALLFDLQFDLTPGPF